MSPTSRLVGGATALDVVATTPTPGQKVITWWDAAAPPPISPPKNAVKPVPPGGRPLSSSRVMSPRAPTLRSAARYVVLRQRQESMQDLASLSHEAHDRDHDDDDHDRHHDDDHDRDHDHDHERGRYADGGAGTGTSTVHQQSFGSDPDNSSSNPPFPTDRQVNQEPDAAAIPTERQNPHPPSEPTPPSGPDPSQRGEANPAPPEFTAPAIRTATEEHRPMQLTADLPHRSSPHESTPAVDPTPTYPSLTQVDVPPTTSRVQATWPPQDAASAAAPILSEPSQRTSEATVTSSDAALSNTLITATYSSALSTTPSATTNSRSEGPYDSLFGVRAGHSRSTGTNYNEPEPTLNPIDRVSDSFFKITPTGAPTRPTETGRIESTSSRSVRVLHEIEDVLKSLSLPGLGDPNDPPGDDNPSQSGDPSQQGPLQSDTSDGPPTVAHDTAGFLPMSRPTPTNVWADETQHNSRTIEEISPVSVVPDFSDGSPRSKPTNELSPPGIIPPSPPGQPPTVTIGPSIPPPVVPNIDSPQSGLPLIIPPDPVTEAAVPTSGAPQIASQPGTPITGHQKVVSGDLDDTSITSGGDNGAVQNPDNSGTGNGQDNTGRLPSIVTAPQPGSPAAPGAAGNIGDATTKQAGGSNALPASAMGGLIGAALVFLVAAGVVAVRVRRRHRSRHIHAQGKRAYAPFDDDDLQPMAVAKTSGTQITATAEDVQAYCPSVYPYAQPTRPETVDAFSPDYSRFHHHEILRGYYASDLSVNTAPLVPLPSSALTMPALMVIPPTPRDTSDAQSDDSPFSDHHASSDMHETISTDGSPYSDRRASTKTASTTDSAMPLRVYSSLLRSGHSSSSMASAGGAAGGAGASGASTAENLLKPPSSPHRRLAHRLSTTSTSSMYSTLSTALRALHWRRSDKAQQRTQRRRRKLLISSASFSSMSSATTNGTTSSLSGRSFATTTVTSCDDYASSCDNTTAWGGSEAGTDSSCTEFHTVLTGAGAGGIIADDDGNASDLDVWLDEGDDDGGAIDEILIVPAQRPLPFHPIRGS
ncbi:hypothetical protein HDU87_005021 [Geranomyces variabilis]|uniref:Uncharacterized protein n=1 Tax=Geranomyces variabilis TaxID=109894 RepID=A0AAD5XU65_9FUNG|nr:hypothetical protein HDU87_005021 [Geranomyces variabilis]